MVAILIFPVRFMSFLDCGVIKLRMFAKISCVLMDQNKGLCVDAYSGHARKENGVE